MKVGVAGLTHLGIVSTITFALKGFEVIAFDSNSSKINKFRQGKFNIQEKDLQRNYLKTCTHITWTDILEDLSLCEIVFITLDIESTENGDRQDFYVDRLIKKCLNVAKADACIIINSQVLPGTTRKYLESAKQHKVRIYYQVETLIFGEAFNRALNPKQIIIGTDKSTEFSELPFVYQTILKKYHAPTLILDFESAEFAKICINLFLIFSIIYTDTMSQISVSFGADWKKITEVLRRDERIGRKSYLSPSLGLNGLNLMRDFKVIEKKVNGLVPYNKLLLSIENISTVRRDIIHQRIKEITANFGINNLFFFGIAYKDGTSSLANSPSFLAYEKLKTNYNIDYYDPLVKILSDGKKSINLEAVQFMEKTLLIITKKISIKNLEKLFRATSKSKSVYILDPNEILDYKKLQGAQYYESLFTKKVYYK